MGEKVPPWQRVIAVVSSPKVVTQHLQCPPSTNQASPTALHWMLQQTCPISTSFPAPKDTRHVGLLFLHNMGPTGTIRGPLCTSWVSSISKPLPNRVAGSRGSHRARHHTRPVPDIALSLSVSPPFHTNIIQFITPRAKEEEQLPLRPEGPRVFTLCYYEIRNFIHFPMLFPAAISHRALNHCCLREMLEP